jgi:hypothetical protein
MLIPAIQCARESAKRLHLDGDIELIALGATGGAADSATEWSFKLERSAA